MLFRDINNGKLKLRYDQTSLKCKFCKAKGHTFMMCMARPTVPEPQEAVQWADALIASPQVSTAIYEGLSRMAAHQKLHSLAAQLNTGNPWANSPDPRNSIRKNLGLWKAIGANKTILSWHVYGICFRFHHKPDLIHFLPAELTQRELDFCFEKADKLIDAGKYWKPPNGYAALISPQIVQHSLRDDGTDKQRAVDNLVYLNSLLASHKHKMETLKKSIPLIVRRFDLLFAHDYSDAYHFVWLHPSALRYACLSVGKQILGSKVLPFGLKTATFIFTKINRPILSFFRAILLRLMNYLDDWVNAESPKRICEALFLTLDILTALGWVINMDKQSPPATALKALGFVINSISNEFENIPHKETRLKAMCVHIYEEIKEGRSITNQTLGRVLGYAISLKLAVPSVPIFTRPLYKLLDPRKEAREEQVKGFGPAMLTAVGNLPSAVARHANAPFAEGTPVATVIVDTSVSATGGVFYSTFSDEEWERTIPLPSSLIGTSSTMRELSGALAILKLILPILAVQSGFDKNLPRHKTRTWVRLIIDSAPSIYCLKKPGSGNLHLNKVVELIFELTRIWNVCLIAEWSARDLIQQVDDLSKKWERLPWLSDKVMRILLLHFHGLPIIMPPPNKIGTIITQRKRAMVLVHPHWVAQDWWILLNETRTSVLEIGDFSTVFNEKNDEQPDWLFQASLILP